MDKMSEQKYYVYDALKANYILIEFNKNLDIDWILEEIVKHDKEDMEKCTFAKSELEKIMDGAFYKGCILPDGHEFGNTDCKPWINPLIQLVPVEEEK